jgi:glycosyltransferase involved in cell wall biosynthesis
VGSFSLPKNHQFLVRIAAEVMRSDPNVWLLLVGQGPLRFQIEKQILTEGITPRVVFAGARDDVPRILLGAMDVFVFPSLYEGLPLSVMEAQAAGLPVAISNSVTAEVQVVDGLMRWLSLTDPVTSWAEACLKFRSDGTRPPREECYRAVKKSSFNIHRNAEAMQAIYAQCLTRECRDDKAHFGHPIS